MSISRLTALIAVFTLVTAPVSGQEQTIRGAVLSSQGVPLDSTVVRASSSAYVEPPAPDTTDSDGRYFIAAALATTSVESVSAEASFDIESVYPNPFSSSARICSVAPRAGELVTVITDVLGRKVMQRNEEVIAGRNCLDFGTAHLAAGLYVFTQSTRDESESVMATHIPDAASSARRMSPLKSGSRIERGAGCIDVTIEALRIGFEPFYEEMCLTLDAVDVDIILPYAVNQLDVLVSDAGGDAVAGATVSLDINGDGAADAEATTGPDGLTTLAAAYYGPSRLVVEKSGYSADSIDVFFGSTPSVNLVLEELFVAIPAASPLTLPTYDGSGQTTHPDVLDMAWELESRGVGGTEWPTGGGPGGSHRYWMWHTPYPFNDSSLENPSLLVSDTGDAGTWAAPAGLTNPVFGPPDTGFYADPDAFLGVTGDTLFVVWKHQQFPQSPASALVIAHSTDGVAWSDTTHLMRFDGDAAEPTFESPAVVFNEGTGEFEMYGSTVSTPNGIFEMDRITATDPLAPEGTVGGWTQREDITLGGISPNVPGGYPWHLDVRRGDGLTGSETYRMAVTLREYDDEDMWWCESADGLAWACERLMTFDATITWTSDGFYRPSFVPVGLPGQAPLRYRMWYGGISEANEWRVGETSFSAQ